MTRSRDEFSRWSQISTRWEDVDVYGHVNNVKYYAYFDSVINEFLVQVGGLVPKHSPVVGYIVENHCTFSGAFNFPETIDAAVRVAKLGTTSVTYDVALFRANENLSRATGCVVHVFVDRHTERPVPIPDSTRLALSTLLAA